MSMSYRKIYTSPGNNVRSELEQDALGRVLHVHARMHAKLLQSCPTLCNTMACSPPGSSVYGIFQATILEWVAVSFSRGSSQPRDQTQVSCVAGRFFTV